MKILHTIASMASQSGGTTACTRELVQTLNDLGCATRCDAALKNLKK